MRIRLWYAVRRKLLNGPNLPGLPATWDNERIDHLDEPLIPGSKTWSAEAEAFPV